MRIYCPSCGQKAYVTSRNNLNDEKTVADLYCQCLNTQDCGASFVMALGLKRILNPPVNSTRQLAANLLNSLPKHQRDELLKLAGKA